MKLFIPWKVKAEKVNNKHVGIEFNEYKIIDKIGSVVLEVANKELAEEICKRVNRY